MTADRERPPALDMTGIAGVVGASPETVRDVASAMHPDGTGAGTARSTRVDGPVGVHTSEHPPLASDGPAETADGDATVWVIGELYGIQRDGGYRRRPDGVDNATFVAGEIDRAGLDAFAGLNGHFVAVVHDREAGTASVVTDRLGTHAVHWARPSPDTFAFATQIQALVEHEGLQPTFDEPNLLQYLRYRRVVGTGTPLAGVKKLPPSSITTVDLADGTTTTRSYWEPRYRPIEEPFEYFVDRFTETFRTVIDEWADPDRDYGVLLSGGSDSRLLLAALEEPDVTAYHMGGWRNREARVAERAAREAGCDFQFLEQDEAYDERLLAEAAELSNFDGYFYQGYALPFRERLAEEVDVLASGLYADTLFKGTAIPQPKLPVGPLGSMKLPVAKGIAGPADLVEKSFRSGDSGRRRPAAIADGVEDPLFDGLSVEGERVTFHGVEYADYETFLMTRLYYPLSNDTELIYTNSMRQIGPYRSPFLDNRLIDLQLRMPMKYQLRRDVVARALERLAPELAAINHEPDGTPLSAPFGVRYAMKHAKALARKAVSGPTPPEPYMSQRSQRDHGEFIRTSDFFPEKLGAGAPVAAQVPALDEAGVRSAFASHLDGEDRTAELYTLLTALSLPVTREIAGIGRSAGSDGPGLDDRIDLGQASDGAAGVDDPTDDWRAVATGSRLPRPADVDAYSRPGGTLDGLHGGGRPE